MNESDKMQKIISLAKRRGFIFQSSEIYGGLKSCYDFGPLGVELKNHLRDWWWQTHVYQRDDIYGLDASIFMQPEVWKASGHLDSFSDPLIDCKSCKERFRADKAPKNEAGEVQCPQCASTNLSEERQFNLMFYTPFGPVDPTGGAIKEAYEKAGGDQAVFRTQFSKEFLKHCTFLRPETAQAMFVQFLNITQSQAAKVPFGIAQVGKAFRNEIITEHFIFRSAEFEQMEIEFFVHPGEQKTWLDYWADARLKWFQNLANHPEDFVLRPHDADELAHYADACFDIEYKFPWGFDELEGIASRTDYDLKKHAAASRTKLTYFDPQRQDPATGKTGWRFTPFVVEPSAGLTRGVLSLLCDAYTEEETASGNKRTVLKLHPKLAPVKVAVLPLLKNEGMIQAAESIRQKLLSEIRGIVRIDASQSIGKRYAKHDEIGTPFCVTIDEESLQDRTFTIRDRDSAQQIRLPEEEMVSYLKGRL